MTSYNKKLTGLHCAPVD